MSRLRVIALRLRGLFRKSRLETDLRDELHAHIEMLAEENMRRGLDARGARDAAMRDFGGVEQVKEAYRERRGVPPVETFLQDLRYAAHSLRRNPGFAAVAGLALALGIGANTAIFSFADVLLQRPVDLPQLDRLVSIVEHTPPSEDDEPLSPANYLDLQDSQSFDKLSAYQPVSAGLTGQGDPEQIAGIRASTNFFDTLGVVPAVGRAFLPEEEQPGKDRVVMLSDGFWRRKFGADPATLGHTLKLDDQTYTIIGVMPPGFSFPHTGQNFWIPLSLDGPQKSERREQSLSVVGRLREGTPLNQAGAETETKWKRLEQLDREANAGHQVTAIDLREHLVGPDERRFTWLLVGVVGFVLLIACANVANLQLARGAGRQRELALRRALGAGRPRIVRQLLTESVMLSLTGAALGLPIAVWGVSLLRTTMPAELLAISDINSLQVNSRALLFTFCLAVAAGVLAGIAPAWQNSHSELHDALKEGGRTTAGRGPLRRVFVVAQLALALILLIGASLMVKGFAALASASPELEPARLLTFTVSLPKSKYPEPRQVTRFYQQALESLGALPAVQSAAIISGLPYSFYDNAAGVTVEGDPPLPPGQLPKVMTESVSGGYFRTMLLPLRRGRTFEDHDTAEAPPIAIISESMAQRLWPGSDPVGKRLKLGTLNSASSWITIAGVAADTRHEVYDRSFRSVLYRPYQQNPAQSMDFAVRSAGDPMQLAGSVRAAFSGIDKYRPIELAESMATKIRKQASGLRYVAGLMGTFGFFAVVLAAVGVYGVMAYSVGERRHEIGIRMALGARRADVLRNVMARGLGLTLTGLAIGLPLALALSQLLASFLYGVGTWDVTVFILVPVTLAAIALVASYIPARRATRVDPVVVLRYE
jgi:putative ABC transport system permease protein